MAFSTDPRFEVCNKFTIFAISPRPDASYHIDKIGNDYLVMSGKDCELRTNTARKALNYIKRALKCYQGTEEAIKAMPNTL